MRAAGTYGYITFTRIRTLDSTYETRFCIQGPKKPRASTKSLFTDASAVKSNENVRILSSDSERSR